MKTFKQLLIALCFTSALYSCSNNDYEIIYEKNLYYPESKSADYRIHIINKSERTLKFIYLKGNNKVDRDETDFILPGDSYTIRGYFEKDYEIEVVGRIDAKDYDERLMENNESK